MQDNQTSLMIKALLSEIFLGEKDLDQTDIHATSTLMVLVW